MATVQFSWSCCNKDLNKRLILENILPPTFKYKISSFKVVQESDIQFETKFEAVLSVNICSEEGLKQFLTEFEASSSTNYNIYCP